MNHESESYCTVLATCILTMLMSGATMIIMPNGLLSSTVDRDLVCKDDQSEPLCICLATIILS